MYLGDPSTALVRPNTIVLTESMAKKYFGEQDPIDQTMYYQNQYPLKVTAIIEDVSGTSHLPFDILISHNLVSHSRLDRSNKSGIIKLRLYFLSRLLFI